MAAEVGGAWVCPVWSEVLRISEVLRAPEVLGGASFGGVFGGASERCNVRCSLAFDARSEVFGAPSSEEAAKRPKMLDHVFSI